MIIPPIFEFGTVNVDDSGVPGKERIVFRPTEPINLAQCGLLIGWREPTGAITPLNERFFWFGEITVTPPCWIVVYTGKGQFKQTVHEKTGHPVYFYYWGNDTTIFNVREAVPVLFKIAGIQIGGHLKQVQTFEEFRLKQLIQPPQVR